MALFLLESKVWSRKRKAKLIFRKKY